MNRREKGGVLVTSSELSTPNLPIIYRWFSIIYRCWRTTSDYGLAGPRLGNDSWASPTTSTEIGPTRQEACCASGQAAGTREVNDTACDARWVLEDRRPMRSATGSNRQIIVRRFSVIVRLGDGSRQSITQRPANGSGSPDRRHAVPRRIPLHCETIPRNVLPTTCHM